MMKIARILMLLMVFATNILASQIPHTFTMGSNPDMCSGQLIDVSNRQSWEETRYELRKASPFLGTQSARTELRFWNNRLYEVAFTLAGNQWEKVKRALDQAYGDVWGLSVTAKEKSGQWGSSQNRVSVSQYGGMTYVTFTDDAQKAFHLSDLFRGVLLYIILAIAGLFVLNYAFATLINRYCRKCGKFTMSLQAVTRENLKDYSTDFFERDFHSDQVYAFRCTKCGHVRKDRYTGLWSYLRSRT